MKLVYVFNYREATGYVFRAPEFIAKLALRFSRRLREGTYDYAPTEAGY